MTGQPNVVFVCIDCLREDFLAGDHADTPFLDQLRDRGRYFSGMYSTTTTTTPSVASFMTGYYSERNGVTSLLEAELDEDVPTLPELFSDAGYGTYAMVTGPLVEDTGLDRGFDRYWYREKDEELVGEWGDTAADRIHEFEQPFFLYLHLWEIHTPIDVPDRFDSPDHGGSDYARMLSAVDRALEEFVDGLPDDTIIVVHGDHGESISWRRSTFQTWLKRGRTLLRYHLGINTRPVERMVNRAMDRFGPDYPDHFIEDGHGETVFDFVANVPFLLVHDSVESGSVGAQCRQIDVFPTLLDAAGIDLPQDVDGVSLLGEVDDRPAYIRACGQSLKSDRNWIRAVRADDTKLITYPDREWPWELYDLEEDAVELRPVDDMEVKERLEGLLPSRKLGDSEELDIKDRLEDLGYM